MSGCRLQLQLTFIVTLVTVLGLTAATLTKIAYERLVQQPLCFTYAATHLPDTTHLVFERVVIATNQFHGHECIFRKVPAGSIVALKFDDADIPVMLDTVQVLIMVLAFLAGGLPAMRWWPRYPSSKRPPASAK